MYANRILWLSDLARHRRSTGPDKLTIAEKLLLVDSADHVHQPDTATVWIENVRARACVCVCFIHNRLHKYKCTMVELNLQVSFSGTRANEFHGKFTWPTPRPVNKFIQTLGHFLLLRLKNGSRLVP